MAADNIAFKDFSKARRRIIFKIDPDEFEAFPAIPVDAMQELSALGGKFRGIDESDPEKIGEALAAIKEAVDTMLLPDSAEKFKKRMSKYADNPIDVGQFMQVFQWLSEVYANRPPASPDTSSTSSRKEKSGTGSTATTKRAASKRSSSLSRTSSTSSTTGS